MQPLHRTKLTNLFVVHCSWKTMPINNVQCQKPTVKFLNFQTTITVIYLKIQTKRQNLKDANGIANSEDPDQTAPLGAV